MRAVAFAAGAAFLVSGGCADAQQSEAVESATLAEQTSEVTQDVTESDHPLPPVVSAREAHAAATASSAIIIDVRRPGEWARTGVPEGAATLTLGSDRFAERARDIAAGRPIIFSCRSGARSAKARDQLEPAEASSLDGGFIAWQRAGLPVSPAPEG